jgi:SAM-dependent methyltransferase
MRPPRYLLREATLKELVAGRRPGRFLEVGHGAGFTLTTLAELGFEGVGYDRSEAARAEATRLLAERRVDSVRLVEAMPEGEQFDYVFLLEVVGYFDDPLLELRRLRALLKASGTLFLSFNGPNARYARGVDSDIRPFTRHEMRDLVVAAGFGDPVIHNYGFPLVNVMRPFLNAYQTLRRVQADVGSTGLHHRAPLIRAVSLAFGGPLIAPFAHAQRLFRHTELGNGYVLAAGAT